MSEHNDIVADWSGWIVGHILVVMSLFSTALVGIIRFAFGASKLLTEVKGLSDRIDRQGDQLNLIIDKLKLPIADR